MAIKMTETRLRNIIKSVINESNDASSSEGNSRNRAYFLPDPSFAEKMGELAKNGHHFHRMLGIASNLKALYLANKNLEEGKISIFDMNGNDVTSDFSHGGKYAGKNVSCIVRITPNNSHAAFEIEGSIEGKKIKLRFEETY
jgi:hypothetical protein